MSDATWRDTARDLGTGKVPLEEFLKALDDETMAALWAKLAVGRMAWVVEVESPGEWQSVEALHATEAGARAHAEARRLNYSAWPDRSRVVHVSDVEMRL
jgi:hypothetical protein